ncbi:MAG: hypothetical protein K8R54_06955 [Bacteroidales bacterium]|nr:hypothetical protein [Bacteroidales bacterium]
MKKLLILFVVVTFVSCSDNLSNSKAEKILKKCFEKEQNYVSVKVFTGDVIFYKEDMEQLSKYKKLADDGYLIVDSIGIKKTIFGKHPHYNIQFTSKSKDFILEQNLKHLNLTYTKVLLFDYEIDEVTDVHENPSTNTAVVNVNLKQVNITPFKILMNDKHPEIKVLKLTFRKTNNRWKYCDD